MTSSFRRAIVVVCSLALVIVDGSPTAAEAREPCPPDPIVCALSCQVTNCPGGCTQVVDCAYRPDICPNGYLLTCAE